MTTILRQSTAKVVSFGPFLDKTDGVTLETALAGTGANQLDNATTGVKLSKNGGALALYSSTTDCTYDSFGNYFLNLDTTDTNTVGTLRAQYTDPATCLPVWQDFQVIEEAVYDALFAASAPGYLQPATPGRTLVVDAAGLADANMVKSGPTGAGTAQTAGDLAAMLTTVDDFVDAEVAQIIADIAALVAGLFTDAQAEPTGVPSATAAPLVKTAWMFKVLRRKLTLTSAALTFFNAAGVAEWKKPLTDDGTTYTEADGSAP